jgi:FkbM family methyltransferase
VGFTLRKLAQPGEIALDIGANIGATALELARGVGSQGRVVCFEPMPDNLDRLRSNLDANRAGNIDVEPIALSDVDGHAEFNFDAAYPGRSTLGASPSCESPGTVVVRAFDSWTQERGYTHFGVAKIDVEGHEGKVFAGMEKTLSARSIDAFVFERHLLPDTRSDAVFELLKSSGYDVFRIYKSPMRVYYVPVSRPCNGRITSDFVAVLPGKKLDMIKQCVRDR